MRAYFFGNMYLSSIQQGIQAAHVTAELFMKAHSEEGNMFLLDWANNHKTMILLNAGYSEELRRLIEFFDTAENRYPWASFNEGQDALDGALTCVGIVIPEKIYRFAELLRNPDIKRTHNAEKVVWNIETPSDYEKLSPDWKDYLRLIKEVSVWDGFLAERLNEYGLAK